MIHTVFTKICMVFLLHSGPQENLNTVGHLSLSRTVHQLLPFKTFFYFLHDDYRVRNGRAPAVAESGGQAVVTYLPDRYPCNTYAPRNKKLSAGANGKKEDAASFLSARF